MFSLMGFHLAQNQNHAAGRQVGPRGGTVPVIGQASLARGEVLWGFFR